MSRSTESKSAIREKTRGAEKAESSAPRRSQTAASVRRQAAETGSRWTFLTNHAHVLARIDSDPNAVLREVAAEVGITERAVQRIIQDLEEGGFIERRKVGRRNQYRVLSDRSLRHPIESHRKIGDLLDLING